MIQKSHLASRQQGFFLIIAVIFILVIGVMGSLIAYMFASRANVSVAEQGGLSAFYLAESGLEVASRLLVGTGVSTPLTCDTLTGDSRVTNASLLGGTFTATAVGGALYLTSTTLSTAITSTSNSMTLTSTAGFAPHGRIRIDSEAIEYAAISGSDLVGLNRGMSNTIAANHNTGAIISQSVCLVNVKAGIPSIASPTYKRELEMAVEILSGAGDIWGVGSRFGNRFSFVRWNSPTPNVWNDYASSDTVLRENLNAVSLASASYGWAVGNERSGSFSQLSYDGASWSVQSQSGACSGQNLLGVDVMSASEGWAVGVRYVPTTCTGTNYRYTIRKWNGSSWVNLAPGVAPSIPADGSGNQNLNAISMLDVNNDGYAEFGFAVGDGGRILRYDGANWAAVSTPGVTVMRGVAVVSTTQAWAVGNSGAIWLWNGASWASVSSPTTAQLNAIAMYDSDGNGSANFGWAVGNGGVIIYYNGSSWSTQTSGTTNNLAAIGIVSTSSAWTMGASSTIRQWNGSSWVASTSPYNTSFAGISIVSGGGPVVTGTKVGSWQQNFN